MLNFVGIIKDLHSLRTAFNKVSSPYIHVAIRPNTSFIDIIDMVNSTMAKLLIEECRKALIGNNYRGRLMQRREGDNTLIVYLENHHEGICGSLYILKTKYAQSLYDYLSSQAITYAIGCHHVDKFDFNRFTTDADHIRRYVKESDNFQDILSSSCIVYNNSCISNNITIGKLWTGLNRFFDNNGDEVIQHVKLGMDDGKYHIIIHEMSDTGYEGVINGTLRVSNKSY